MANRKRRVCSENYRKFVRNCCSVLMEHVMEFCRNTGLHGYKYIGESHRFVRDRIVWAITVFVSLCTAIAIIKYSYGYYSEHRIYSVIKSTHQGIWNYPFPAVTVCDFNRVSLELTRKLVDKLELPPSVSKEFIVHEMRLLNELLYPGQNDQNIRNNLSRLQYIFESNDLSIPTVVNAVTQNCQSLLKACKLKTFDVDCNTIFEPSVSRDGLCCSFNYITRDKYVSNKVYPLKITSCGYQSGLTFLVELNPNDYHASFVGSVGVKVMLHDPYDYPDFDTAAQLVTSQKLSFMTVIPEETYSTDNVQELPISERYCVFANEWQYVKPKYDARKFAFSRYSYRNCLTECRTNVVKTKCGCIPYYYPQNETRVCNLKDIDCLEAYKFWYTSAWPGVDFSPKVSPTIDMKTKIMPCGCKTDCNFYRYFVEKSEGTLDNRISHTGLNYSNSDGTCATMNRDMGYLVCGSFRAWQDLVELFGDNIGCTQYCFFLCVSSFCTATTKYCFFDFNLNTQVINNDRLSLNIYFRGKNAWHNESIIHVFFGDLVSIQYRRDVRYSWRHIFATFGGLLGLFAGFSLMTIFECIYFFVIRILTDICSKRKNTKNVLHVNY